MEINVKTSKKDKNNQLVGKYKQYLLLEKSLSGNTLDAYMHDLSKLLTYLMKQNIDVFDVTLDDLYNFIAGLHDNITARSQATPKNISSIHPAKIQNK